MLMFIRFKTSMDIANRYHKKRELVFSTPKMLKMRICDVET